MTRFHSIAGLVALTLILVSGCHCIERTYSPVACCDSWDPVLGSCQECGLCGGDCEGHTPCSYLKHQLTCSSGCGEIYWGEWLNDPPADCDPCNNCGQWVGPQSCGPNCLQKLASWVFGGSCGGCTKGCNACSAPVGGKSLKGGKAAPGTIPPMFHADPLPPEPTFEQTSVQEASLEEAASDEASIENARRRQPRSRRFRIRSTRLR